MIILGDCVVNGFMIVAGMLIAGPGVDSNATRRGSMVNYGLAEGKIRESMVDAEFHDESRAQPTDKPEGEWGVLRPGRVWSVERRKE